MVEPYIKTIRCMGFACWVSKAADTHSEYAILLLEGSSGYANARQCYVVVHCPYCSYLKLHMTNFATIWIWLNNHVASSSDILPLIVSRLLLSKQWRTEGGVWGVQAAPPPNFRRPSKLVPNSTRLWKLLKIAEFKTPTPRDVRKKGSKILKLPRIAIVLH
jgi:hypothetical protein